MVLSFPYCSCQDHCVQFSRRHTARLHVASAVLGRAAGFPLRAGASQLLAEPKISIIGQK